VSDSGAPERPAPERPTDAPGAAAPDPAHPSMPAPRPAPMPVQDIAFWTPRTACTAAIRRLLRLFRPRL